MRLKEFIDKYQSLYDSDYELITQWAIYNDDTPNLIDVMYKISKQQSEESARYKHKVKEWSSYAFCNLSDIKDIKSTTEALNMIRLVYLGYNDEQFKELVKKIMNNSDVRIDHIKSLHPEIYERLMKGE